MGLAIANKKPNQIVLLPGGGIPVFLAPSGSFADNGVLTLGTALLTAGSYYLYFPADAIYAGSAAGKYYTEMSSTTAGIVYNNTYTEGTPTIPVTLVSFAVTGPGAYTQTVDTSFELLKVKVKKNLFGIGGTIQVSALIGNNNTGGTKTASFKYNAATFAIVANTTNDSTDIIKSISSIGINKQALVGTASFGASSTDVSFTTEDTSTDLYVSLLAKVAVDTDWMGYYRGNVQLFM